MALNTTQAKESGPKQRRAPSSSTRRESQSSRRSVSSLAPQHRPDAHNPSDTPTNHRSITFGPISYTSVHELRLQRSSISQAPEIPPLPPVEPLFCRARTRDGHIIRRSSSSTLPSSRTRPSVQAHRRWSFPISSEARPLVHNSRHVGFVALRGGNSTFNSLRADGVDQRDFALFRPDSQRPPALSKYDTSGISASSRRRVSSWTSNVNEWRRSSSKLSIPDALKRRASHSFETLLGGVLVPTAEEIATYYSTPSAAAFDLDIEKGAKEPEGPVNPARSLTKHELTVQRLFFGFLILGFNVACVGAIITDHSGAWVLAVILFFKSRDFLSVLTQICCGVYLRVKRVWRPIEPPSKTAWILSLIPTYSESEEQIVRTLVSLRDNDTGDHKQVVCVILDGKHRGISHKMKRVTASFKWKYVSLKWKIATLQIDAGFVDDIPTLCIEKMANAGKKDTLVLCHDLFNFPRDDMDESVRALREEIWTTVLPQLTGNNNFPGFDMIFCTDADSFLHKGALASLADACLADPNAIAACGFVFVEHEPGLEWSFWNIYQEFQYSFGQIVRRRAEHFFGKVTCLPGCITMIVVRPEMARAIQKYAKPVSRRSVLRHQVQYLGTDRRLTYCMLSEGPYLHPRFVPEAGSETVAPQNLKHYLSQRRRWGSNAYFNNYFYLANNKMLVVTRIVAAIEILRSTMVYFRLFNMALFFKDIITHFDIIRLLPLLFISFTPTFWYAFVVMFKNRHLRQHWTKLLCGFCINRIIGPFMSLAVFSLVAINLGSQVWGISGVTSGTPVTPAVATHIITERAASEVEAEQKEETVP